MTKLNVELETRDDLYEFLIRFGREDGPAAHVQWRRRAFIDGKMIAERIGVEIDGEWADNAVASVDLANSKEMDRILGAALKSTVAENEILVAKVSALTAAMTEQQDELKELRHITRQVARSGSITADVLAAHQAALAASEAKG